MPAYIARYELGDNALIEVILERDTHWSARLDAEFDRLAQLRQPSEPMLQGWYYNDWQTNLMAWTNQPYTLD